MVRKMKNKYYEQPKTQFVHIHLFPISEVQIFLSTIYLFSM